MAASKEWTDYHLSPAGWTTGDRKRDNSMSKGDIPFDRVLTMRFKEECNGYGPGHGFQEEVWRSTDHQLVAQLLQQFGPAPKEL